LTSHAPSHYKNTDLKVSEVGFGLWTISTGWWGNFTEGEAIALMHKAFHLDCYAGRGGWFSAGGGASKQGLAVVRRSQFHC